MELRHLETFAMAAELQSFTRAGEALSVTQAAVSQHIAAIEKELRVSLFERTGRSVKPTAAGRRFYEYVRKVLDLLEQAKRDVASTASVTRGTLRIAACAVAAELLLPEMLATFRPLYPQVQESLTVCDSSEATRAVVSATADLAVVAELPGGSDLRAQPIACDELLLVVPPDHHLAAANR